MKAHVDKTQLPNPSDHNAHEDSPELDLYTLGHIDIPPFPLDVLPHPMSDIASRRAELIGTHPDFLATSMLAVAGAAIGRSVVLEIKRGFVVWPAGWYALVGHVGSGKSPAIRFAEAPLVRFDAVLEAQNEHARQQHEAYCAGLPRGEPKAPGPSARRVRVREATFASLVDIHSNNPFGLLYSPDELTTWLRGMDVNSKGNSVDRSNWLSARQGSDISQDRISAGTRRVANPAITLLGGLPPDMLREFIMSHNDGLVERLLFCYPHFENVPDPKPPSDVEKDEDAADWGMTIDRLLTIRYESEEKLRTEPWRLRLDLDRNAAVAFYEFECRMVERLNDEDGPERGFFAKIKHDVGHWALTLALIELGQRASRALSASSDVPIVQAEHIRRAERIAEYYLASARKVLRGGPKISRIDRRIIRRIVKTRVSHVDSVFLNGCFNSRDRPEPEEQRLSVERLFKARVFVAEDDRHLIVNPRVWGLRSF